ncbi:CubicO group peptidase, beta-lactamase class C family [Curtobacterium sp. 9128]|uniref:serine hydrolase domain-containing protein n=1 Tax=Curtobacterium sp. 9128 TaxID=1793722 RepID=UPI0007D735FC|nr:serine hydrolase [Curtobacterium sp. 9128]SBN64707.1 CubicO group peptidase, beta-lactamase class C family [Curtobacterium sp. 9128]
MITDDGVRSGVMRMLNTHQTTVSVPEISVGRSAARCPVCQARALDIVLLVRTPANPFRPSDPIAARHVTQATSTAAPISTINANTIAPDTAPTLACWSVNGKVPGDRWRGSLRTTGGWRTVSAPRGPYADASLLEWGSITKGLVGTTASITLEVERPVAYYLPGVPDAAMAVADLVHHTSGLPRVPATIRDSLFRDPYRSAVGVPLDLAAALPVSPRGQYVYSNLGYALLGAVLDKVHGDWFAAVRDHVLQPAGITSAALVPDPSDRVMPRLLGRAIRPWALGASSFAAAGGVWSTFDDLCRYADWALESGAPRSRTVSWQRSVTSIWINGEVRAAGAVIASAGGVTAVVHALAKAPGATDRIAAALVEQEVRRTPDG